MRGGAGSGRCAKLATTVDCKRALTGARLPTMPRTTALPHVSLRGIVHSYWGMVRDLGPLGGFTVMPDTFVEVLFWQSAVYQRDGASRRRLGSPTVLGPLLAPMRLEFDGELRCASIRLPAWSRRTVLGEDDAVYAHIAPVVHAALRDEAWDAIWETFDQAVAAQLSRRPPRKGRAIGRRQRERRARAETTVSPAQLRNLARFERALTALWNAPEVPLAAVAVEHGYADQSHFTRQFKRYSGMTPTLYLAQAETLRAWQRAEEMSQTSKTSGRDAL
jgi:AraC-like DNA-binding protein